MSLAALAAAAFAALAGVPGAGAQQPMGAQERPGAQGSAAPEPRAPEAPRPYTITGDGVAASLTGQKGDPARGRTVVMNRQSTCLLCHSGPFPEEKFQGNLAPDLKGTGARWTEAQLRLRMVDAAKLNAATIMPSYYRVQGLTRVAPNWRGKPILSAEQIEDVVAFLATLRD